MKNKKFLTLITSLTVLTLTSISILNKVFYYLSTRKNLLSKETGEYYDWRFGKIFYKKAGSGSPLLLIHTLDAAASSYEWNNVFQELCKSHTVYAIDLLGCGKSEKPKMTYTNYLYVQLISDFIKNVIGRKADVITSGKSGSFVTMACNIDSSLFHKIMMLNPASFRELQQTPKGSAGLIKKLLDLPIIGTLLFNLLYNREHIDQRLHESYLSHSYLNGEISTIYAENAHINGIGAKYLMSSLKGHFVNINIVNALRTIDNSIYLVVGKENPVRDEILSDYCECNPAIETCIVSRSKKYTQIERPDELLKHVEIFF